MFFPPNSGDLNPIETAWAQLRTDLAVREFDDLKNDKVITVPTFKRRVSQILTSYSLPGLNRRLFVNTKRNKKNDKETNETPHQEHSQREKAQGKSILTWRGW